MPSLQRALPMYGQPGVGESPRIISTFWGESGSRISGADRALVRTTAPDHYPACKGGAAHG